MRDAVLIDGVPSEAAWLHDRGFQFGDGLFETLAIRDGEPCLWSAHMDRLRAGAGRLGVPCPDPTLLYRECCALAAGHERAVIKIYVTAGDSARGYRRPPSPVSRRILSLSSWPYPPSGEVVWRARMCAYRLSENAQLAGMKHLNRLDQVLARAEWQDDTFDEGIVRGQDGRVVSGTMSNIFLQHGNELHTPSIDSAGIAGVVRRLVIDLSQRQGTNAIERRVEVDDLWRADAIFMTNSLVGIARLVRLDDRTFDPDVAEHPAIAAARLHCHRPGGQA